MLGYDNKTVNDVAEKFTQLRTFLLMHAAFTFALLVILGRVSRTQELLGFALFVFGLITLVVLWSYHRADKAVGMAGGEAASLFKQTDPPCGGVLGRGGAVSSFAAFVPYAALIGGKLLSLWSVCTPHGERLEADGWTVTLVLFSTTSFLFAIFFAELARFAADRRSSDGFI